MRAVTCAKKTFGSVEKAGMMFSPLHAFAGSEILQRTLSYMVQILHQQGRTGKSTGPFGFARQSSCEYLSLSIKSLEGFRIAWIEEAQTLLLRPTIPAEGSQIWACWNPRRKSDAIDEFLRQRTPENAIVVKANWRDNPWLPDVMDEERKLDLQLYPERYAHIWEGAYATASEGAFYARHLEQARCARPSRNSAATGLFRRGFAVGTSDSGRYSASKGAMASGTIPPTMKIAGQPNPRTSWLAKNPPAVIPIGMPAHIKITSRPCFKGGEKSDTSAMASGMPPPRPKPVRSRRPAN
jgi:hypothetical protein